MWRCFFMQRNLKCLYIKENSIPEVVIIPNTLKAKQEKVNGLIEYTYMLNDYEVAIICNEEGKINGMNPNRDIGHDIIFGPFLIVGETSEDGEDRFYVTELIRPNTSEEIKAVVMRWLSL